MFSRQDPDKIILDLEQTPPPSSIHAGTEVRMGSRSLIVQNDGKTVGAQGEKVGKSGTYGTVFRVKDKASGKELALKILKPPHGRASAESEEFVYRLFEGDCATAEHIGKPNLLSVPCLLEKWEMKDGGALLLTRWVQGEDGERAFRQYRPGLTEAGFLSAMQKMLEPLVRLHFLHVAHGDVKLGNMIFDFGAAVPRVAYIDYGLSCKVSAMESKKRSKCHARWSRPPSYMDPQYRVKVKNLYQADMYSVGHALRHCLNVQRKGLSAALQQYLEDLVKSLQQESLGNRPTAFQTLEALRRAGRRVGDVLVVGEEQWKVERCIGLDFNNSCYLVRNGDRLALAEVISAVGDSRNLRRACHLLHSFRTQKGLPQLVAWGREKKEGVAYLLTKAKPKTLRLDEFLMQRTFDPATLALSLAKALQKVHKASSRAVLLGFHPAHYVLVGEKKAMVHDLTSGCSLDMQRDKPWLCSNKDMNIFAEDVLIFGQMLEALFPKWWRLDGWLLNMLAEDPERRPTLDEVVQRLSSPGGPARA